MLAATGCTPLIDPDADGAILFDIGGGSSELVKLTSAVNARRGPPPPDLRSWISLPLGVVTLAERHGGIEVTRLGRRHKAEPVVKLTTPRGETAYWIGPAGGAADAGPGTDFHAVAARRVSVTPLRMDLTHNAQLPLAKDWFAS